LAQFLPHIFPADHRGVIFSRKPGKDVFVTQEILRFDLPLSRASDNRGNPKATAVPVADFMNCLLVRITVYLLFGNAAFQPFLRS